MNEPNELSPEARALIAQASGGDDPSPKDRARVRRAMLAAVAGGAGVAASTTASSAAAATAASGVTVSLSVKIAAAVLVIGAISGTVAIAPWEPAEPAPIAQSESRPARRERVIAQRESRPARREPVIAPAAVERAEPAVVSEPPPPIEPSPASIPQPAPVAAQRARSPAAPREPERIAEAAPAPTTAAPATAAPTTPSASTLPEEMRLLRGAHAALNAGDPDAALARLAEHARRFPSGAMVEEREAARILALCRADRRDEARAAADRFLRERPSSPLAARVRASCE